MENSVARPARTVVTKVTLLLAALVLVAGCKARGEEAGPVAPPPPEVDVAPVLVQPVTVWQTFTGQVAAPETVELRPRVSGYIDKVTFTEGARVTAGDVLFQIDPRPYEAKEQAASAALAQARSELAQAKSEADRANKLLASRAISQEEHEKRSTALSAARARVDAAKAALDSARLELTYTQVKAPISGRIGRALVTQGNLASADQTRLTTIVSVDPVYVYFDCDEQTALTGRTGATAGKRPPVRVAVAGETGFPHEGTLDFIDNQVDAGTGTLKYRAVLANPDDHLRPGQFARVKMPVDRLDSALLIDRKAVMTNQDRRLVYVVDDANKVEPRQVVTGHQVGDLLVIESGLEAGDQVIVNGQMKVFGAGMMVNPNVVKMHRPPEMKDVNVAAARS